jgi:coenzyme F420 hydrogenase subunit delta
MHISHNMQPRIDAPVVVIFGCGNVLLGDDGFGPAVIEQLLRSDLPESVSAIDAGTAIREYLLDYLLLPALRPAMLIVVDAWSAAGELPGQVRQCVPADLPMQKTHDFSLHQFPTVNLLAELGEETGIEVVLLVARTAIVPDRIEPGLSPVMQGAVAAACARIVRLVAPYTTLEVPTT